MLAIVSYIPKNSSNSELYVENTAALRSGRSGVLTEKTAGLNELKVWCHDNSIFLLQETKCIYETDFKKVNNRLQITNC